MMKIFLVLTFVFCSCNTEVSYENLSIEDSGNLKDKSLQSLNFNPQVEMMILFLWPKDLGPKDEKEVIDVISTSRKISTKKEQYLSNLFELEIKYRDNNCDCHLVGLCEDDIDMDDNLMLLCDEITYAQDDNNQILASLTLDHELIKEQLDKLGAINIDVGVDDEYLDIGTFDVKSGSLKLNKFGYNGSINPLSFKVNSYIDRELKAKFIFNIDKELFTGDLGISDRKYNVIFSGEIQTSTGLSGLIYWEHLK